ncbi:hypothetical protein ACEPAI_3516 [Sanghuangporus weigelae]
MESSFMSSIIRRQLEASPEAVRQAVLLFAVLKELLYLLLAVARGAVSLEDVHVRFQALHSDCADRHEAERNGSPVSPSSDSEDSESTFGVSERAVGSSSLMSAVRILCRAIVQRDAKAVSRMLEAAPRLVGKRHEGGWFPLHAAVLSGDVEIVKLVLACPKADVNAVYQLTLTAVDRESELGTRVDDTNGATPLHYACMVGNSDIIRMLVERGALMKAKDGKQRDPIEYLNLRQDLEAATVFRDLYLKRKENEELFKVYTKPDDLARLVRKNKYEKFENSIKKNPYLVSCMTYYDFTLLHLAVIRRRRRFVKLLVSMDKSVVNKCDRRADYNSDASHISFAPLTIPHINVKNATPLHYACLMQDMDIAKVLLEAGADWTIRDLRGRRPEELIRNVGNTCDEIKEAFAQLRDAESRKRKEAEEEKKEAEERNGKIEEGKQKKDEEDESEDNESDYSASSDGEDDTSRRGKDTALSKVSMKSLLELEVKIGEKLVGQRGPIRLIANAIRLREGGWVDPDRPLTMLFLGSSGVGKTELAKQLALYLHGKDGLATDKGQSIAKLEKEHGFVRIDMSEFQERHTVMNLIGAPKSYVGYGDGGALTQPLKKNPKAVVLLDEIEKAHPDVLNTFLQVFDDGRVTDSKDGTISCKDAIFIMTSNIAGEEIKNAASMLRQGVTQSEKEERPESYLHLIQSFIRSIRPQLKYHLRRDEFVGRINQIVVFLPLSQEEVEVTVQRELEMWSKRAKEKHKISLTWTDEVVHKLAESYDVNYGVRSVANEVQRIAMQLVADAHIRGRINDNSHVKLATNEVGDIVMNAGDEDDDDGYMLAFSDFLWVFEHQT